MSREVDTMDRRALRESTVVSYGGDTLRIPEPLRESLRSSIKEMCRMMQEQDSEYADCWTHAICHWNDGPEFSFGGSFKDCMRPHPIVARVEVVRR